MMDYYGWSFADLFLIHQVVRRFLRNPSRHKRKLNRQKV